MAYTDFTLNELKRKFGIINKTVNLFATPINEIEASDFLLKQLQEAKDMPIKSEKARSELIVMPILMELRRENNNFFTIYSGDTLNADKEKGLVGECDFILAKDTASFTINVPLLALVEAKKQNIEAGIAQCAAQMLGAKKYNAQYLKTSNLEVVYGCVTTANDWKFLKLEKNVVEIDKNTYYLSELTKILGIFQYIIDFYKKLIVKD